MDIKIEPKRKLRFRAIIIGLVAVALAGTIVYSNSGNSDSQLRISRERLKLSTAELGVFQDYISVRASVTPIETLYLDVVQGGRAEEVFVEEGSFVKQGDALARLSNSQLQLDVISREAEVSEQLNFLRNSHLLSEENLLELKERRLEMAYEISQDLRRLKKGEKVLAKGGITEDEIIALRDRIEYLTKKKDMVSESLEHQQNIRETQLQQLEESAAHLQKNLKIARKNLELLTIRSSIDGQLTSFEIRRGQSISAGERVGQVDNIDNYKLQAFIDEYYLNRVAVGQQARLQLQGSNYVVDVRKVSPEVINGQFKIELYFNQEKPPDIRRGQTIKISLGLGEPSETLLLSSGSYLQDTGGNWLFVLDSGGNYAVKRSVRMGRTNPDYVEILEGLEEGEKVITSSYREINGFERLSLSN